MTPRRPPPLRAVAAAVTLAGMIATPLRPRGGAGRRRLAGVVVGALGATTFGVVARRFGPARAAVAAGATFVTTTAVEHVGSTQGVPFGRYAYTDALRPQIAGVPAIVPVAWFAMAAPAREAAHVALGDRSTPGRRIALGAAALTAWDLFLDPQMVGEGYWRWERRGRYRGIPVSNYVGWLATSIGVMAILEITLPPSAGPDDVSDELVAEYATMAVMETLGFARFFRDGVVAAVGGVGMLVPAAAAVARLLGRRT